MRSVLFPKQGNRIKVIVPNSICILGIFCLKQGQGFKPSPAQLYSNAGRVPPRDSSLSSFCILFYHTNSPLPGFFFQSPLPRPRHVDPPPALALLTLPLLLLYFAHLILRPPSTDWPLRVVGPCPQGLLPFPSSSGCNLIRFEYHSRSPPRCHWRNLTRNKQFLRLVRTSSWAFQRQ